MATERIIIEVQTRGTKTVQRNLDRIGKSAKRSATILQQLRNALVVVAAARVIGRFTELADSFINLRNRLQATLGSFSAAIEAQEALIKVALETRTGIDATGDAFARLALGAKDLGLSTQTLIGVTRTLNQAIILGGSTAQEARNALVQFSQGIASGALRGDELRSVLEQLPLVARIIADEFDVTIGKLRELGTTGQLTTDRLIKAFQAAEGRIGEQFANTVVTIDQALANLTTNFTVFLDRLSTSTGLFAGFASVIGGVSDAFAFLADNLGLVTGAFAFLLSLGIIKLFSILLPVALIATNTALITMTASATAAGTAISFLRALVLQLNLAFLLNPAVLLAVGLAALIAVTVGLSTATENLSEQIEKETMLLNEQTKVIKKNAISTAKQAREIRNDAEARFARLKILKAESKERLSNKSFQNFEALNKLRSFLGLDKERQRFQQLSEDVVEAGDNLQKIEAIFRDLAASERLAATEVTFTEKITDQIKDLNFEIAQLKRTPLNQAIAEALDAADETFDSTKAGTDEIRRLVTELDKLEKAQEKKEARDKAITKELEKQKDAAEELFEASLPLSERAIRIDVELSKLRDLLTEKTLDQAAAEKILADEKARLVKEIEEEIAPNLLEFLEEQRTLTEKLADAQTKANLIRLEAILLNRSAAEADQISNKFLAERIKLLKEEEAAAGQSIVDRFFTAVKNSRDLEKAQEDLNKAVAAGAFSERRQVEALKLLQRELVGASNAAFEYEQALQDLAKAEAGGAINAEEAIGLRRDARLELLETQRTASAGAERAILKLQADATDAAAITEEAFTTAFKNIEDAVVQFAETGKLSINSFFRTIAQGLIRLGTQQALASFQGGISGGGGGFLGSLIKGFGGLIGGGGLSGFGGGIGGNTLSAAGAAQALIPFQRGGSFRVDANSAAAALPGIDNRLIQFAARDGEDVSITPRGGGGVQAPVNQVFNIQARDADSFVKSQSQIQNRALAGINQARRRR